ncbi:response regulator transcription factor [Amycolatopsis samaneae]|uniref:Response regulator transcription factor n=1 Tax=Amycolatopsis samaneae TaxID=664691 RepID=A0ABW5GKC1_9PSEU
MTINTALTARETQVLRLAAAGMTNARIGAQLRISEKSVKSHLSRIFRRLGAKNRANAVHIAYDQGIISPDTKDTTRASAPDTRRKEFTSGDTQDPMDAEICLYGGRYLAMLRQRIIDPDPRRVIHQVFHDIAEAMKLGESSVHLKDFEHAVVVVITPEKVLERELPPPNADTAL